MTAAPLQRVTVPSFEYRTSPEPHYLYAVHVELPTHAWTVYRRYSDFAALHAAFAQRPPPYALPPKHNLQYSWRKIKSLGGYLSPSQEQQNRELAEAKERQAELEKYVRAMVAAANPYWRESEPFQTFIELADHASPRSWSMTPSTAARPAQDKRAPTAESRHSWLAGAGHRAKAQETDTTRPMSDTELMQHQTHTLMAAQDQQADQLAKILRRQREIGLSIHDELQEQQELIQSLTTDVQNTKTRMNNASERMQRLGH